MQLPKPILTTPEGLKKLQEEQEKLLQERPAAVLDLKKAREMGDLSENGYYKSARFKLSSIDSRLRYLAHVLRFAKVQEATSTEMVNLGTTVHLEGDNGEIAYMIVGEHEANPSEKKISHLSPLGKALMYKKIGQDAHFQTPKGKTSYTIRKIT